MTKEEFILAYDLAYGVAQCFNPCNQPGEADLLAQYANERGITIGETLSILHAEYFVRSDRTFTTEHRNVLLAQASSEGCQAVPDHQGPSSPHE